MREQLPYLIYYSMNSFKLQQFFKNFHLNFTYLIIYKFYHKKSSFDKI